MAYFAPVCPAHIARELRGCGQLGPYHLLLAHDVLKTPDEYRSVFCSDTGSRNEFDTIIMDNSIIELGSSVDLSVIVKAVDTVQASVVVLPDVLMNAEGTVTNIVEALPEWRRAFEIGRDRYRETAMMFVPQGENAWEWAWCAQKLSRWMKRSDWWGIPRNFCEKLGLSRREAVDICNMLKPECRIHLLGFSDDPVDDLLSARYRGLAKGIDSAVPVRLGDAANPREFEFNMDIEPRGTWWDNAEFNIRMADNCAMMNKYLRA